MALTGHAKRHRRRKLKYISYLVIHRTMDLPIKEIAEAYQDMTEFAAGSYTGGTFPYHFLLEKGGQICQCLPLTFIGLASGKLNKSGIQVALAGDLRKAPPTPKQAESLVSLCRELRKAFPVEVVGHTEKKGTSKDPNKVCPGSRLDLVALRVTSEPTNDHIPYDLLYHSGIILGE